MSPFFSRPRPDPEKNEPGEKDESLLNRISAWVSRRVPPAIIEEEDEWTRILRESAVPNRPYSDAESSQASAKLWTIYVGEAERYDKALVESWKADMEGMLIFSGLFSASLTAFLIESYRSLQPDPGDSTVRLLAQISDQLVALSQNISFVSPAPPVFNASPSSLVCNVLWFLSLTLSLTCALLATLVEQWAREFLHKTEKRPSPVRRARVFAFLYFGVRRFGLHFVVDLIPLLLHIALVLFLAGLVAFLSPINQVLMGLIGASLALFLMLYAMMTILPLVRLDCPYRTPFSSVAWNILQRTRRHFRFSPSSTSNITDAVVDMALADSAKRDQLALKWTLDSLTDDVELLPFLEAIPEAIHGIKGFHLVNDHLFIPLLNNPYSRRGLGDRIADFIFSCRNLDFGDPRREKGLIAGMKAIWALGMISGRDGELFTHGSNFWFNPVYDSAVRSEHSSHESYVKRWPVAFGNAASMAIQYSAINNLRNQLASVLDMTTRRVTRDSVARALKDLLPNFDKLGVANRPPAIDSTRDALQGWDDTGTGEIVEVATLLTHVLMEGVWIDLHVSNLCRFVLQAANVNFLGGDLPYEFEQTCFKILPLIPAPGAASRMPRVATFAGSSIGYLDPSRYFKSPDQMSKLDRIMACFLRLLPCLAPSDCMAAVTLYLATRNDDEGLDVALQHCALAHLIDCLTAMLEPKTDNSLVLHALCAVLVRPQYEGPARHWTDRDDILYDFMTTQSIFDDPRFLVLSTVMRMRQLYRLWVSTVRLIGLLPPTREEIDRILVARTALAAHPLILSGTTTSLRENTTAEEILADIRIMTTRPMIICLTAFILASVESPDNVASGHTMGTLLQCFSHNSESVDAAVMVNFANAWLALVRHLVQNPEKSRLNSILRKLTNLMLGAPKAFYSPTAAPQYEEALKLYLGFLGKVGSNLFEIQMATRALAKVQALAAG
ncbi:hypothetical protein C8R46DRAFT_961697 [Mycena filopes]|nr:hypothetical protein C8R46DRAFT_961697 [Mycena filopes]